MDAGEGPSFSSFQQDLTGKTREFRARVTAGEHWVAASVLRLYEGLPAELRRPEPVATSAAAAPAVPASGERHAGEAGGGAQAVRGAAAREVARQRGAGPPHRADRPVRRRAEGPSPESLQKVYACGHLTGEHGPACPRPILDRPRPPRLSAAGDAGGRRAAAAAGRGQPQARRAVRAGDRPGLAGHPRLARLPVPHRDGPPAGPGDRGSGSARTSWPRASRISSGPACPTRSCFRCAGRGDAPGSGACWPRRSAAC